MKQNEESRADREITVDPMKQKEESGADREMTVDPKKQKEEFAAGQIPPNLLSGMLQQINGKTGSDREAIQLLQLQVKSISKMVEGLGIKSIKYGEAIREIEEKVKMVSERILKKSETSK